MGGHLLVKQAFVTDVTAIIAEARRRKGGAIDPIRAYRVSAYRRHKAKERPPSGMAAAGIV
jgi:L-rhamnose isomerase/sugar isomerase